MITIGVAVDNCMFVDSVDDFLHCEDFLFSISINQSLLTIS